jgi:VWFA-related protein
MWTPLKVYAHRLLCIALLLTCLCARPSFGQQTPATQDSSDEVVRITTELVQTDVMVLDKGGKFVDGLGLEQFELLVDGKSQPISFFERVTAGSSSEEVKLAAARGGAVAPGNNLKDESGKSSGRGRTMVFYVDDLHLKFDSLNRVKKSLTSFVDKELGINDSVAIASASGRIGFLQQFTNDVGVLRAAVERLKHSSYGPRDAETTSMSEHQAQAIDTGDASVLDYFVEAMLRETPAMARRAAEEMVKSRARNMLQQAGAVTTNSLAPLEGLMRVAARMPGRKLVFFISDGFLLDNRNSSAQERVRQITGLAARSGVVIYSIDAKGLATGMQDASRTGDVDISGSGRLTRSSMGELSDSQNVLFALALDTGGRAFINSNALTPGIQTAIKETSAYYLLAWRPDPETQRGGKYRKLEVKIAGHPEWTVRARRGYVVEDAKKDSKSKKEKQKPKSPEAEIKEALVDLIARKSLPLFLNVSYIDMPGSGGIAYSAVQLGSDALSFDSANGKQTATIDLVLAILNDKGKQVSAFKDRLSVAADVALAADINQHTLGSSYQVKLAPGLYQVRVAAREAGSGRIGSAVQWIEIPDLSKRRITMSSLLIAELKAANKAGATGAFALASPAPTVRASTDRHIGRASKLRFVTFVYNASRGPSGNATPDVALKIQLLRGGQSVLAAPLRKVTLKDVADLTRIPYVAEIPLNGLPSGQYVLVVTALDQMTKLSATQQIDFVVN